MIPKNTNQIIVSSALVADINDKSRELFDDWFLTQADIEVIDIFFSKLFEYPNVNKDTRMFIVDSHVISLRKNLLKYNKCVDELRELALRLTNDLD